MNDDLSEVIIKCLLDSELSSYQISKDTDISDQTISNYRKGKSKPRGVNLKALSNYFGISEKGKDNIQASGISANYQGHFTEPINTILGGSNNVVGNKGAVKNVSENKDIKANALILENEKLKKDVIFLNKKVEELQNKLLDEKERLIKLMIDKGLV